MFKADYQHLLPLKNSSNLFKGPRTPPRSSGSPAPLSASVGPLKSTPEVGPGSDRQKHKAFGDKCVKMSNIDLAPLTYSNLTPQRDLFDKRGFKQSTATALNCYRRNATQMKDFAFMIWEAVEKSKML